MNMASSSLATSRWRAKARRLLDALNDFATATASLQWLFEDIDDEKLYIIQRILLLQNRSTNDDGDEIDSVVAAYNADDDESATGATSSVDREMVFLVMSKPALLFATSIYDEELAMVVWRGLVRVRQVHPAFNLLLQVMDNTRDSHGLSSLHYAIDAQLPVFFRDVCEQLTRDDAVAFRQAVVHVRSHDVVLPMAAKQVTGKSITSGGCTVLHLAARKGELEIAKMLMEEPVAVTAIDVGVDWDGMSVAQLAALHHRDDVCEYLGTFTVSSAPQSHHLHHEEEEKLHELQTRRDQIATCRYAESMVARAPMTQREVFDTIWTAHECGVALLELLEVTEARGWSKQRHTSYPTTDLPCYQVASVDAWVRNSIQKRLFPQVYARYSVPLAKVLTFRELFYVRYDARPGEQAELPLHCDGSVLSFNILLNPRAEFQGGGTYFEQADVTLHIEQGDAVVHSGKVRHAGAVVTEGTRTILVGFLDLVDRVAL